MSKASKRLDAAMGKIKKLQHKGEKSTESVVGLVVLGTAAVATGYASAAMPNAMSVKGIPVAAIVGAGLYFAGAFGVAGKQSAHLGHAGLGMLAVSLGEIGRKAGSKSLAPGATARGEMGSGDYASLREVS